MLLLGGVDVLAVEVHPRQVAPVVPVDHPVDVQHRHDEEDEVLPQDLGLHGVADQVVDHVLDQVAHHALPGMHSGGQHDRLLPVLVLVELELRDLQVLTAKL